VIKRSIVIFFAALSLIVLPDYFHAVQGRENTIPQPGPDITTAIRSSVTSLKAQSELLVLTSHLNSTATSQTSSMGMTAQMTDLVSADVQYRLKLYEFNEDMIAVRGDRIEVSVPHEMLILQRLPPTMHQQYDNGSWLFSVNSGTAASLHRANTQKINSSLSIQAQGLSHYAQENARQSLQRLIQVPLNAAGIGKKVTVRFT